MWGHLLAGVALFGALALFMLDPAYWLEVRARRRERRKFPWR